MASEAEPALEAMANFRMAESALQRNDTASAERLAKKAVDGDPSQVEYVTLLAWIRALRSSDPKAIDASIATITDVLEREPDLVRALLYRAKLYKRRHNAAAALADLDLLLSIDPEHKEAQNEVRALRVKR